MKMAKETWIERQCHKFGACFRTNNSKKPYKLVKDLNKEEQVKSTARQDNSGKCLIEEPEIHNRVLIIPKQLLN